MADDLSSIISRLENIERALSRLMRDDLINPVDPAPDDIVRFRPELLNLRLRDLLRDIIIKGDPPPFDLARIRSDVVRARLGELLGRNPGWFSDPPPEDFLNVRILDLIRRYRGGFTDPAPEDLANIRLRDLLQRIPGGGISDPGPEDLGRLSKSELETQLHRINSEMVRLKSLERMINEQLGRMK
jgi:hypothetical protein